MSDRSSRGVLKPWLFRAAMALLLVGVSCAHRGTQGTPSQSSPSGPHGGPAVALPDDHGWAEIVLESEPGDAPDRRRLAVYFFQPDWRSGLTLSPSDVRVTLEIPGQEPVAVTLVQNGSVETTEAARRFVSAPGEYVVDPLVGELELTLAGQAIKLVFTDTR